MDVTISLDKPNITLTEEKFIKRAMLGHQQIQEGKCKDSEEVFKMLEERYRLEPQKTRKTRKTLL